MIDDNVEDDDNDFISSVNWCIYDVIYFVKCFF